MSSDYYPACGSIFSFSFHGSAQRRKLTFLQLFQGFKRLTDNSLSDCKFRQPGLRPTEPLPDGMNCGIAILAISDCQFAEAANTSFPSVD